MLAVRASALASCDRMAIALIAEVLKRFLQREHHASLRPPQVVTKRPCEQGLFFASYRRKCVEVVID